MGDEKIVQNGQTEPKLCLGLPEGVQRQSKADTLRFAYIAKHPLNCLLFLLPKKHVCFSGSPKVARL